MTYERERERTEFGVLETGLALVVDVPRNTNITGKHHFFIDCNDSAKEIHS